MMRFAFLFGWIILLGCGSPSTENGTSINPDEAVAGNWQEGKQLFQSRCASCHMVNKELSGPALKGVENRWPDKQLLYSFIRNSQEVIKRNKYARELWLQYNQTIMIPHSDLTDSQIHQLLGYINSVSTNVIP